MPDVLLFGATGYTGSLTARALARRGVDFAVCGRDQQRLEAVAAETGGPEVRVAAAGETGKLASALEDCKVLITTVGPFTALGHTAVEAALVTGVHYVDSCGEGTFIQELIERHDISARRKGISLGPAMAFDEAPADLAATLATEGLGEAELTITYAVPSTASRGTIRSSLGVLASTGPFIESARPIPVATGQRSRWAPMPPPLGPRHAISAPLAELWLAPLHLSLSALGTFLTTAPLNRLALSWGMPLLRAAATSAPLAGALGSVLDRLVPHPEGARAKWWTILAEARSRRGWRNVAIVGRDLYGLSGELLAAAGTRLAAEGPRAAGVVSPVQALGADAVHKQLLDLDASVEVFEESRDLPDREQGRQG